MLSLLAQIAERSRGLRQVLRDPRRKPAARIILEAADVTRRTGAYPEWYFLNFAYRRDSGPYTEFLHRAQYRRLMKRLRERELFAAIEDKLRFQERLEGSGVPLPRLLASNEGKVFRVDGTERHVPDGRAFASLMAELRQRSATGSVFAKPVEGRKGCGCHRVDAGTTDLTALHAAATAERYLFQETLAQHPALDSLFPGCINTLRMLTCLEPGGRPIVVAAILRLGVGASAVDNASQGGIFVGVELASGRLLPLARRLFKHGGEVYDAHPDTGSRFDGFEIPRFREALAVTIEAATRLPHDIVGWDLAVTRGGPVLIEGNALPHLPLMEIGLGRGLMAHPAVRGLYERTVPAP